MDCADSRAAGAWRIGSCGPCCTLIQALRQQGAVRGRWGAQSRREEAQVTEEIHYKILKLLESRPEISQRQLSKELGVSLGKANYCLKAMLDRGWIKARNFKNSQNKIAYAYLLTPAGVEKRAKMTARFLKRKMQEYEQLKHDIEQLQKEVALWRETEGEG
jgi:EPS-associated MarR family transcriptional regulator